MTDSFQHGQEVMVLDLKGNFEFRGKVMGVHRTNPWHYDVQRDGYRGLAGRVPGIAHAQLRSVGKPIRAYDRQDAEPKHVKDDA